MRLSKRFQAAHAEIVQLLQRPGVRDRMGVHAERGPVSAGWLGAYQARHSHEHVTALQPQSFHTAVKPLMVTVPVAPLA